MVCNVAGWWTVHAGWWWWWCTQGGRVVWVVRTGRWTPGGGRARESAAFSDGNVGRRPQVGPPESARIAGWAPGWSREQLDAAEEEDEFALFADVWNDAAINTQHEALPRRPPTLRHHLAPLRHQMSMAESDNQQSFLQAADMGELYARLNST